MYPPVLSICFRSLRFFAVILLLLAAVKEGYGQRVYANGQIIQNDSSPIYTPTNNITSGAVDPNHSGYTQWTAPGGLSAGSRDLTLNFPFTINRAVFIKVDNWDNLTVRTSTGSFSNGIHMSASNGDKYISIFPATSYNSIVIRNTGTLLGGASTRHVYYAFHETPSTSCVAALGTSENVSGLLPLSAGIEDIDQAIDGDLSTNSRLYVGVGLGTMVTQTVYFSNLSNPGDAATVTLSANPSLLSVGLLGNTQISLYNGAQYIDGASISSLLQGTDLLGLLQNAESVTLSFVPTENQVFDRIEVSLSSLAGVATSLNLWEVARTPTKPTVPTAYPDVIETCEGETVSITATSPSSGSILRWYDTVSDGTLLQESTGNSDTYTTSPLPYISPTDTTFIYVASSWESGCPAESERTKIAIVVRSKPTVAPISGQDDVCVNDYTILTSATAGGIWSSTNNTIAAVDPSSGTITGISAGTAIIRYTISDDQTSCSNYQEKPITVHPKPGRPDLSVSGN